MLKKLFLLLIILLILSAILTPFVYSGLLLIFDEVRWPYSRVYDRVILALLIVAVIIYRKKFNLKQTLSYFKGKNFVSSSKKFGIGFIITLIPVIFVVLYSVDIGSLVWKNETNSYYLSKLLKLIPSLFVISFMEELIFRAFIFRQLISSVGLKFAIILSSIFYTLAHFVAAVKTFVYDKFDIMAGFKYYSVVVNRVDNDLIFQFIVLFIVGIFLAYIFNKTKSIYICAGLHAGWIAGIKGAKYLTNISPDAPTISSLAERYYLLELPATWVGILVSIGVGILYVKLNCISNNAK